MRTKLIIAGIAALIFVAGGAFLLTNKKDDNSSTRSTNTQVADQGAEEQASINELLARGENIKCTYSYTDDKGNKSSGTTYIAQERMRGNFTTQTSGQNEQTSHIIRGNQYQYVWNEGSNSGFKVKISALDNSDQQSNSKQNQQSVDQDKKYDFDCSSWSVDESMFKVPGGIQFTDYSAQIKQSQQAAQEAQDAKKNACAQISNASARTACENAQ